MAYTVWGAFDKFRGNTVDIDPSVSRRAKSSRDYLFDQLKTLAKDDPYFPRLTGSYIPYGSFARKTKIRPLDDIDFLLLLNGQGTQSQAYSGDPYTYWLKITSTTAPLSLFPDDHDYVNSTKVLNKIKGSLALVSSYRKAETKKNMQAVTLNLISYDWAFDIVPAVPISDSSGATAYYLIPNGRGDWIRTDPRIDAANVTKVNTWHGGNFLPTIRLLKYWNWRTHKPRLSSYYFENLALKVFQYASKISSYHKAVKYFFDFCPSYLMASCPDPKNLGPALDADVDWDTKQKVSTAMTDAATLAGYALWYEGQDKHQEAINNWRRIFGPEFPTYGS
ncbi:MAG: hypothetical protein KIT57_09055 [Blastocatellales bacterium]|nr:hypothetical protein [Blastocatellales bacterium]